MEVMLLQKGKCSVDRGAGTELAVEIGFALRNAWESSQNLELSGVSQE